jgi:hypothetical protein
MVDDNYHPARANQQPYGGGASLTDILTAIQDLVTAWNNVGNILAKQTASSTSEQLSASTLVQTGFVRVKGISVTTAGAVGTLNDASTLADAASGNVAYVVAAATGYVPLDLVFEDGLVYQPGAAQVATIFYTRV